MFPGASPGLLRPSAGARQQAREKRGLPVRTTDSARPLLRADPLLEPATLLPPHPSSQTPGLQPMGLPLAEPDMDTINYDQFSKLLQDMEMDEETREAYANIGKEAAEAREGTEKNSLSLISLGPSRQNHS